jgi:hypothetical protein
LCAQQSTVYAINSKQASVQNSKRTCEAAAAVLAECVHSTMGLVVPCGDAADSWEEPRCVRNVSNELCKLWRAMHCSATAFE